MKSQPLKISQAILANFPLFCIINFQIITIVNNGVIKEIEKIEVLQIPMGTAASHLARGKAAVAAYIELVPELEKSSTKELSGVDNVHELEIVVAEVVDKDE